MSQIQGTLGKDTNLDGLLKLLDFYVREEEKARLKDSPFDVSKVPQKRHADRALFASLGYTVAGGGHLVYIKPFLAAFELLDESILVDDDIVDKSAERLGEQTVHQQYGIEYALLMSNDILHRAVMLFVEAALTAQKPATIIPFLEMSKKINEGQRQDNEYAGRPPKAITIEEYMGMVKLTTGVHIGDSLMIGAMLAGSGDGSLFKVLEEIGVNLGIAGQIYDDVIDWFPEINKTKGSYSDYNGRKARLPYLVAVANPETREATLKGFTGDADPSDMRREIFIRSNYEKMKRLFGDSSDRTRNCLQNVNNVDGFVRVIRELIEVYETELKKVEQYTR